MFTATVGCRTSSVSVERSALTVQEAGADSFLQVDAGTDAMLPGDGPQTGPLQVRESPAPTVAGVAPSLRSPKETVSFYSKYSVAVAVISVRARTGHKSLRPPGIETTITFDVEQRLQGTPPASVEQPGGVFDGQSLFVSDVTSLEVGKRYLAFYWKTGDSSIEVIQAFEMTDIDHYLVDMETLSIADLSQVTP